MDKIVKLQVAVKQQEHFEILEELGVKLMTTGQSVESFVRTTNIVGHRANFKELMGYSQVLLELCQMKLSVSSKEMEEEKAKAIEVLLKEYAPEEEKVDFSLEDF